MKQSRDSSDRFDTGLRSGLLIIESHGGRPWATPNKGKGATFRFTLPVGGENDVWPK
jgi:signal transduction histidine kinase